MIGRVTGSRRSPLIRIGAGTVELPRDEETEEQYLRRILDPFVGRNITPELKEEVKDALWRAKWRWWVWHNVTIE